MMKPDYDTMISATQDELRHHLINLHKQLAVLDSDKDPAAAEMVAELMEDWERKMWDQLTDHIEQRLLNKNKEI